MNRHTPLTKETDVRETPAWLFEQRVKDATGGRGFDLDACATHKNALCARYYTETGKYERREDGRVVQILGEDGTTRGLLDLEGLPLAEGLRSFRTSQEAHTADLVGASFDVPLDYRRYPGRDGGVSSVRQSELCEPTSSVSGDGVGQHERLCIQGSLGGTLYARTSTNSSLETQTRGSLAGPWAGKVFVNPPFTELWDWVQKCWRECDRGDVELIDFLMPSTRCEQKGWQAWVEPFRDGRAELVPGWRLTTTFLPGRPDFLKDGKPIMSEPKVSKRTGKLLKATKSTPKFGLVMLTWQRQLDRNPVAP